MSVEFCICGSIFKFTNHVNNFIIILLSSLIRDSELYFALCDLVPNDTECKIISFEEQLRELVAYSHGIKAGVGEMQLLKCIAAFTCFNRLKHLFNLISS